jgi:hypothetical protein
VYGDFTDRVGDPVPVIGSDGTPRFGADLVALTVAGLLTHAVQGSPAAHLAIAHPAHWGRYELSVLHSALANTSASDATISLVSAPIAAITAAESAGAAQRGEAVLVADIGSAGTELTVLTAGADRPRQVVATSRVEDLGADALDRALARHVLEQLGGRFGAVDPTDPANRAALRELVARCRVARAQLATHPATVLDVALPAGQERVRVIRPELESLIAEPISAVVSAIARMAGEAENNGVPIAAVLLTGEPARTPLLTEQLSVRIRARVLVPADAEWTVAAGAAAMAAARARWPQPPVPRPRTATLPTPPRPDHRLSTSEGAIPPVPAQRTPPARAAEPPAPSPTAQSPTARTPTPPTSAATPYRAPTTRTPAARIRTAVVTAIAGFAVLLAGGVAVSAAGGGTSSHLASGLHGHR